MPYGSHQGGSRIQGAGTYGTLAWFSFQEKSYAKVLCNGIMGDARAHRAFRF
jgi:hypothetical protein